MSTGAVATFNDPRRFGSMKIVARGKLDDEPLLNRLGPEPLGNAFDAAMLAGACTGKKTSLKAALLDQRIVAGLGNIYVCEALLPRAAVAEAPGLDHRVAGRRAERTRGAARRWRSRRCSTTPSRPAARRCAIIASPTASSACSSIISASTIARGKVSDTRLRRHHQAHRAERPLDVFLSGVPEMTSSRHRAGGCSGHPHLDSFALRRGSRTRGMREHASRSLYFFGSGQTGGLCRSTRPREIAHRRRCEAGRPSLHPAVWRLLVAAARGLGLGAKSFGWHFCSSDRHGFAGSAPSSHTAITAAMSLLFFSFIMTWLLPWMPRSASLMWVALTPACGQKFHGAVVVGRVIGRLRRQHHDRHLLQVRQLPRRLLSAASSAPGRAHRPWPPARSKSRPAPCTAGT